MNNRVYKNVVFLLSVVTLAFIILFFPQNKNPNHPNTIHFQYYEDKIGNMELEEVEEQFRLGNVILNQQDMLSFGKSESTYWIRIPLPEKEPHVYKEYLSIYNPTVARVTLYVPMRVNDRIGYQIYRSGWDFSEMKQDENFAYPVFKWDENTDFSKDAYIQLQSCFTQNYKVSFLTSEELEQLKTNNFLLHGILFGILFSVVIQSLMIFIQLKEKSFLYLCIYIFFMICYQGNLTGIYNVLIPNYAGVIMSKTIIMSLMTTSVAVMFFCEFFKTKELNPKYDEILRWLIGLIFGGIFIAVINPVIGNFYAHTIANVTSIFSIYVAHKAWQRGFEQARFFLFGWGFMMVGLIISMLRHSGWVPNNVLTINILFIAVGIQSIILFAALVKMVKVIAQEKEIAVRNYKNAQEEVFSKEMAFLQTQIGPHFLYNTLNVIISLCKIDAEKAREVLLDFSDFLRRSFDFNDSQRLVRLKDELSYVKTYVRIEEVRFKDKLNVIYDLDETITLKIPPLILQPLVENAINHGVKKRKGVGRIVLRVKEEAETFRFEVEDDGAGMTQEQINTILSKTWYQGKGVGIVNVNKRLLKYYGQGLYIESVPGEGTLVYFKVPKEEGGDHCVNGCLN